MNNPRITNKERGLIKGAIRRVFSRSDIRKKVLDAATVEYSDANRPRVKKWCRCARCKKIVPKYTCEVDHIDPVVPIGTPLTEMSWDAVVNNCWCEESNLQVLCGPDHDAKSKIERKQRAALRPKKPKKERGKKK